MEEIEYQNKGLKKDSINIQVVQCQAYSNIV